MNIVIVEDDINVAIILKRIIEDRELGMVIQVCTIPIEGEEVILRSNPDIVLIDLLMPIKDGISVVRECKKSNVKSQFIMISQVSSKDMIAKAYESGIDFYISKPINAIEVENVIRKVIEKIEVKEKLVKIEELFGVKFEETHKETEVENRKKAYEENLNSIMRKIGIVGEIGCKDIKSVLDYAIENNLNLSDFTLKELLSMFNTNYKSLEQRIRRTCYIGMKNLANLGIEDYMNETFSEYANSLYKFEEIKKEMDYIRGKREYGGKVNVKKFLDSLMIYCDK